jgi:phospholipase D1/2
MLPAAAAIGKSTSTGPALFPPARVFTRRPLPPNDLTAPGLLGYGVPTMHAHHTGSLPRPAWQKIAIAVAAIGALAALWRFTPLAQYLTPQQLGSWARLLRESTWAPFALVLAFIPAAFVMFPLPVLILIGVLAFGPLAGLSYGMTGAAAAIVATYCAGRMMRYETLRSLLGHKLDGARDLFHGHTIVAAFAVSTVPVPPFGVQGIMAGAMRVSFWQYAIGTLLAMLPGAVLAAFFGREIARGLQDPGTLSWPLLALTVVAFALFGYFAKRWAARRRAKSG